MGRLNKSLWWVFGDRYRPAYAQLPGVSRLGIGGLAGPLARVGVESRHPGTAWLIAEGSPASARGLGARVGALRARRRFLRGT